MKKIISTAVILIAAVVFLLTIRIETPEEHDKRVSNEKQDVVIILSPTAAVFEATPTVEVKGEETLAPTSTTVTSTPEAYTTATPSITEMVEGTPTETISSATVTPVSGEVVATPTVTPTELVTPTPKPTKDVTQATAPTLTAAPTFTPKPTNTPMPTDAVVKYIKVSFEITCEEVRSGDGQIFLGEILVKEGATVLDALEGVCKKAGIPYENEASGYGAYISSIGGIAEMEYGQFSGWKYKVNGIDPNYSCDSVTVKDGDIIVWYYVTKY